MRRAVLSSFLGAFFSLSLISVSAMAQATPEPESAEESTAQDPDEVFVISEVEINGLGRTKEFVVWREFDFELNSPTTRAVLEESAQRLRNMGLFANVEYTLEPKGDSHKIIYDVLERWTILPVVKASSGGGINQLIVGLYDINLLGRYLEMGGQYERLGPTNSGVVWFRDPRLFDQRLWFSADVWHVNRIYTLYDNDGEEEGGFLLQRNMLALALEKEVVWWFRFGGRIQVVQDQTSLNLIEDDIRQLQARRGLPEDTLRIQPGLTFQLGRLNQDNYLVEGAQLNLRLDGTDTILGSTFSFGSIESDLVLAKTLPFKSTIAFRWLVGISSTEAETHFYYIGGFDRVRGFLDARFRGPAHTTANLEFRIPSLDTSWLVLQHVGFVDVTSVGQGASDFTDITAASAGAGIRLISPRIYRLTLRLDYAASLVNSGDSAISFGVQQFF